MASLSTNSSKVTLECKTEEETAFSELETLRPQLLRERKHLRGRLIGQPSVHREDVELQLAR
eukprot:734939-Pyramimonas_sp.AAC.1